MMLRIAIALSAGASAVSLFGSHEDTPLAPPLQYRTGDGYTTNGHGVDVSFPIHNYIPKNTWGADMYDEFINGCADTYNMRSCKSNEESRLAMDRDQIPRQRNFTELGFAKIIAPKVVYEAARNFWDLHKETLTSEAWPAGNTYVNHWVAQSRMCSFEDHRLQPLGLRTKDKIWNGAKPILEAWTGQKLKPTSLYGIRVYYENAILATHVDRLPLVTSAIINVDQDVDEPWPIEVVGHDGIAYNVTLKPGEMALYESHTVLHGRPFKLRGKFFANAFVHFAPVDPQDATQNHPDVDFQWTANARKEKRDPALLAAARRRLAAMPKPPPHNVSVANARAAVAASDAVYEKAPAAPQRTPKDELVNARARLRDAPPRPADARAARKGGGAPAAAAAARVAEPGHQVHKGEDFGQDAFTTGTHSLHDAAANGDVDTLSRFLEADPDQVNAPDENLWTPLHEAARGGDLKTVEFLVEHGANLGDTTITGGSALNIARKFRHNQVVAFLDTLGAPDIADQEL
mmetsp:Transcript_34219/g.105118  ORF Transcript_34219/g.105118 Transcript_34219/m.105118 type:complete len:517 (-) Transcript_34219:38-1588(-)